MEHPARGGAAGRRHQPRPRRPAARSAPRCSTQPGPGRRALHRARPASSTRCGARSARTSRATALPAHRRRDRRQGLHLRARLRRPRGAGGRDRARRLRVPGPEVLRRVARLRARHALAARCASACSGSSGRAARWATSRLHELHGRRDRPAGAFDEDHRRTSTVAKASPTREDPGRRRARRRARAGSSEPTLVETTDPQHRLMREEIFGPVLTLYVYPDARVRGDAAAGATRPTPYALTGAVFAQDRAAVAARQRRAAPRRRQLLHQRQADRRRGRPAALRRRARVGHQRQGRQPWNLMRWVSPRTIKETFSPPTDWRYPFLQPGA